MKELKEFINESHNTPAEQMFNILRKTDKNDGTVQTTLEQFLKLCFDNSPHKDFNIEVGDAVLSIYDEYLK